jgi:hypothetical protein
MFRKLAAAAIAVSLIAGPALAQGTLQTTTKTPATATAVKAGGKVEKSELIVAPTKKHVAMHRLHRKHFAHVKHVKHVKFAKHVKHIKQVKQSAKAKIAG